MLWILLPTGIYPNFREAWCLNGLGNIYLYSSYQRILLVQRSASRRFFFFFTDLYLKNTNAESHSSKKPHSLMMSDKWSIALLGSCVKTSGNWHCTYISYAWEKSSLPFLFLFWKVWVWQMSQRFFYFFLKRISELLITDYLFLKWC